MRSNPKCLAGCGQMRRSKTNEETWYCSKCGAGLAIVSFPFWRNIKAEKPQQTSAEASPAS